MNLGIANCGGDEVAIEAYLRKWCTTDKNTKPARASVIKKRMRALRRVWDNWDTDLTIQSDFGDLLISGRRGRISYESVEILGDHAEMYPSKGEFLKIWNFLVNELKRRVYNGQDNWSKAWINFKELRTACRLLTRPWWEASVPVTEEEIDTKAKEAVRLSGHPTLSTATDTAVDPEEDSEINSATSQLEDSEDDSQGFQDQHLGDDPTEYSSVQLSMHSDDDDLSPPPRPQKRSVEEPLAPSKRRRMESSESQAARSSDPWSIDGLLQRQIQQLEARFRGELAMVEERFIQRDNESKREIHKSKREIGELHAANAALGKKVARLEKDALESRARQQTDHMRNLQVSADICTAVSNLIDQTRSLEDDKADVRLERLEGEVYVINDIIGRR